MRKLVVKTRLFIKMAPRIFYLSRGKGCGDLEIREPNWLGNICPKGTILWGLFVQGDRKIKWVRNQMLRSLLSSTLYNCFVSYIFSFSWEFFQSHTNTQPHSVRLGQFFTLQDKRWLGLNLLWWWKAMKKATFELNKG